MADFLIVGGGIAGASAASRLSRLGSVVLLEAEDGLGYHASGRSAAMFEESYGTETTIALNKASKAHHQTAFGGVLSPRGLMLIGAKGEEDRSRQDARQMGLTALSVEEASALVPILNADAVGFAAHHSDAWDIDTDLLLQSFIKDARSNGAAINTKAQVTAIVRNGSEWVVTTRGGDHTARNLVNAAGAWADKIAVLAGICPIGLQPRRRSMARLPAPGGLDVWGWPMLLGVGETWYAKPDAGKLLVSPADEDAVEPHDAWADDMVIAEGLARYEAFVTEPVTRVETTWAGLRTFSPDRSLIIGPDPTETSFWWFAGQGGYGYQTAPAASELLGQIAGDQTRTLSPELCAALAPDRFS